MNEREREIRERTKEKQRESRARFGLKEKLFSD